MQDLQPLWYATKYAALSAMQLLEGDTPGKVGGHPGDAFDCVYTSVADPVRTNMHEVDPVLTEYIRSGHQKLHMPVCPMQVRSVHH